MFDNIKRLYICTKERKEECGGKKELIQFILMFLVLKWTATECLSHIMI